MRHNDQIVLPYAVSDAFSKFATIKIATLIQSLPNIENLVRRAAAYHITRRLKVCSRRRALVADRCDLPDLSALLSDTNGDGIGDLKGAGAAARLSGPSLGVNAIWISPLYPRPSSISAMTSRITAASMPASACSPNFDDLIAQAHARGLKVLLDFVPNHTSTASWPWRAAPRAIIRNGTGTIWRDGARMAALRTTGSAISAATTWEQEQSTGHYYHAFLKEQADLNWRNPDCRRRSST